VGICRATIDQVLKDHLPMGLYMVFLKYFTLLLVLVGSITVYQLVAIA